MMHARNLKPAFFGDATLARLPYKMRLVWLGLQACCDRAGRCADRPEQLAIDIFPGECCPPEEIDAALWALAAVGKLIRYATGPLHLIELVDWLELQSPHPKERASKLPSLADCGAEGVVRRPGGQAANDAPAEAASAAADVGALVVAPEYSECPGPARRDGAEAAFAGRQAELPGFHLPALVRVSPCTRQGGHPAGRDRARRRTIPPDCPHAQLVALWRQMLPGLPAPYEPWGGAARTHLRARWGDEARKRGWTTAADGLAWFARVFDFLRGSRLLMGRVGPRAPGLPAFVCSLEWLIKRENWARMLRGEFHDEIGSAHA
jgi:hypothetical protein